MDEAFVNLRVMGEIETCFKEKFGIPRQSGLVKHARGRIILQQCDEIKEALHGIETYSHLWIIYLFHANQKENWSPRVRPPRLGGNKSIGVFASRSPYRPNPIGLSVCKLERVIKNSSKEIIIELSGVDMLCGTPVLDIKPYIEYSDSISNTQASLLKTDWERLEVIFEDKAAQKCIELEAVHKDYKKLLIDCLKEDPRPAYKKGKPDQSVYGMHLYESNIRFRIEGELCFVLDIEC
ncbi:MAG: tRNA (N6-threonylcarbamoyladenosine(37)-N6)-methyltransferase TrmO [Planctomycetes bacterium]|nr:tRNA (N6-threonylcarbamoyladenosine(37)-N6)-methyltransferase TrmO [Planctomycetota bacterium]